MNISDLNAFSKSMDVILQDIMFQICVIFCHGPCSLKWGIMLEQERKFFQFGIEGSILWLGGGEKGIKSSTVFLGLTSEPEPDCCTAYLNIYGHIKDFIEH